MDDNEKNDTGSISVPDVESQTSVCNKQTSVGNEKAAESASADKRTKSEGCFLSSEGSPTEPNEATKVNKSEPNRTVDDNFIFKIPQICVKSGKKKSRTAVQEGTSGLTVAEGTSTENAANRAKSDTKENDSSISKTPLCAKPCQRHPFLNSKKERHRSRTNKRNRGQKKDGSVQTRTKRRASKKHRAGRNQRRKWKPYFRLTSEERKKMSERETRRAERTREQLAANGLTLAPYNTTQFLMNDHKAEYTDADFEETLDPGRSQKYANVNFLLQYQEIQNEYLSKKSTFDLVQMWVELEDKIDELEREKEELEVRGSTTREVDPCSDLVKIQVFEEEIRNLTMENAELSEENERLEKLLEAEGRLDDL